MTNIYLLLLSSIMTCGSIHVTALAGTEKAASSAKTTLYSCHCVHTSDKSPPQGQDCNFPGFPLAITKEKAIISGYFGGVPGKAKSGIVPYAGFDGLDFHFTVSLDIEPEAKNGERKIKLHAEGEKKFTELMLCKADRAKVHH